MPSVCILPRMFWALYKREVIDSTGYLQEAGVIIIISCLWVKKMKPGGVKGFAQGHNHRMYTQQQPQHHWSWPRGYTACLKLPSSGMAGEREEVGTVSPQQQAEDAWEGTWG